VTLFQDSTDEKRNAFQLLFLYQSLQLFTDATSASPDFITVLIPFPETSYIYIIVIILFFVSSSKLLDGGLLKLVNHN